eukprot:SAG31_NODE_3768_length_3901_cov_4.885750_1_plen_78_part_00
MESNARMSNLKHRVVLVLAVPSGLLQCSRSRLHFTGQVEEIAAGSGLMTVSASALEVALFNNRSTNLALCVVHCANW